MKRAVFYTLFMAVLVALYIAAVLSLTGCDPCGSWNVSEACIMQSVHATETYGAKQWHTQATAIAATQQP